MCRQADRQTSKQNSVFLEHLKKTSSQSALVVDRISSWQDYLSLTFQRAWSPSVWFHRVTSNNCGPHCQNLARPTAKKEENEKEQRERGRESQLGSTGAAGIFVKHQYQSLCVYIYI